MTTLSNIVNVSVSSSPTRPTAANFGTPAILASHRVDLGGPAVRTYSSLKSMEADFSTSGRVYKLAQKVFSGKKKPKSLIVFRRAAQWQQVVRLIPKVTTQGYVYTFLVDGQTITYTVPAAATVASIVTALTALISAAFVADDDAIKLSLATAATQQVITTGDGVIGLGDLGMRHIIVTRSAHADQDAVNATLVYKDDNGVTITETLAFANNGGDTLTSAYPASKFVSLTIPAQSGTNGTTKIGYSPRVVPTDSTTWVTMTSAIGCFVPYSRDDEKHDGLWFYDATTDAASPIATDLAALDAASTDWYGALLDCNSEAVVDAAAAWIETREKVLFYESADTQCGDSGTTTDVASDLKGSTYFRTFGLYHPDIGSCIAAAMMGDRFTVNPGSDTYAFKTLSGIRAYKITDTFASQLEAKNINWYQNVSGKAITWTGKSPAGEFMDLVRGRDWLAARLRERIFFLLYANEKLPYENASADLIQAEINAQLEQAAGNDYKFITKDTPWTITVPKATDQSATDRSNRNFPGVEWVAYVAGAIHMVTISGVVTA